MNKSYGMKLQNSCCKMDYSFVNRRRADSTHLPCNSTCSSFIANSYEASSLPGIELHHSYWLATKLRPLSLLHCHLQTPLSNTTTPVITPSYPAHVLFGGNNVVTQADHWQGQNMKRSDFFWVEWKKLLPDFRRLQETCVKSSIRNPETKSLTSSNDEGWKCHLGHRSSRDPDEQWHGSRWIPAWPLASWCQTFLAYDVLPS